MCCQIRALSAGSEDQTGDELAEACTREGWPSSGTEPCAGGGQANKDCFIAMQLYCSAALGEPKRSCEAEEFGEASAR